ncbi:MAG: hypothetical protein JWM27_2695 [Gemmatimonadetes bacterium]|nr:hypothetical protein [Gemmatimonadota bacterium]
MTQPPTEAPAADALQFDSVEPIGPAAAAQTCGNCNQPIAGEYHQAGQMVVCSRCRAALERHFAASAATPGTVGKAVLYGLGAAIAGSILYFGVIWLTGMNIGLVAIAVGWMVGKVVRKASGNRGGLVFQGIAVALTYLSIGSMYALGVVGSGEYHGAGLVGAMLVAPFILSFDPIRVLIIGFGLFQAWQLTQPLQVRFTGPYRVAQAQPLVAEAAGE